jgi:hypothetical protein
MTKRNHIREVIEIEETKLSLSDEKRIKLL